MDLYSRIGNAFGTVCDSMDRYVFGVIMRDHCLETNPRNFRVGVTGMFPLPGPLFLNPCKIYVPCLRFVVKYILEGTNDL